MPLPQVRATDKQSDNIPDHDVVTRRQQFRMQGGRRARKEQKKVEKKKQKKENAEKKAAKHLEKTSPKPRGGRKAAEKAKDRQQKRGKKVPTHDVTSPSPPKSRKMRRLLKFSASKSKENMENDADVPKSKTARKKTPAASSSASPAVATELDQPTTPEDVPETNEVKVDNKSIAPAAKPKAKASARKATATKSKAQPKPKGECKPKAQPKPKAKQASQKRPAVEGEEEKPKIPRTRRPRQKNENQEVDSSIKEEVTKVLLECTKSNCCHPSYEKVKNAAVDLEPYKKRGACGIKVKRSYFESDKAKGSGKAHVTYFSGKSKCHYTNMILANLWVSRLQTGLGGG